MNGSVGGRLAITGVSSTSTSSKTRLALRATRSPCRIAQSRTRGVTQKPSVFAPALRRETRSGCSRASVSLRTLAKNCGRNAAVGSG